MSMSRQFAAISVPPRTRKRKEAPQKVTLSVASAPVTKKSRAATGAQIPRGFVTALAADSKYFDVAANAYAFNTTGAVTHLDIVPQGDTVSQRQGKSWQNTNLQIRGHIFNDTAAVYNQIAMYIIWDRQPNKALAGITDILDAATSYSFMKRENKGRFLCIKKWQRVLIGNTTTPATGREAIVIDKWIKLPQECVAQATAADTTGAIGNRVTGALLLAVVGSTAGGTADASSILQFRVGFKDTP